MDDLEVLHAELTATRLAFETIMTPLIASHPRKEELLEHLSQYRRQVVGSRDPTKASLSELLDRLNQAVRLQGDSWR